MTLRAAGSHLTIGELRVALDGVDDNARVELALGELDGEPITGVETRVGVVTLATQDDAADATAAFDALENIAGGDLTKQQMIQAARSALGLHDQP
jgi:hypothetical protein